MGILTLAPQSGIPLIDEGDSGDVTTDQRGFRRPIDPACSTSRQVCSGIS